MNRNQHVTRRQDGKWKVIGEGNSRATRVTERQSDAIEIAKAIAQRNHSELFIHGCDGKIRERNSYGNDPFPPRG